MLVSGADGFVGRHLCPALKAAGFEVVAASRNGVDVGGAARAAAVGAVDGATDWSAALRDVDAIVHLAATTHAPNAAHAHYHRTNVEGTRRLASASVEAGVSRFVYLSSIKVNGERSSVRDGRPRPIAATDVPQPEDDYGRSKLAAERLLQEVSAQHGLGLCILRPPLVYGPGHKGNLRRLMHAVARGWPLPLASIDNARSLIYVANLADALVHAVSAGHGGVYTLADVDISTPALIRAMGHALGVPVRLLPCPPAVLRALAQLAGRLDRIERLSGSLVVDSNDMIATFGWRPRVGWDEAMRDTAQWFRAHQR